ncbi:MAG: serine hydrolase domain-containing protein, partial [Bryobacteraceae bacterium]
MKGLALRGRIIILTLVTGVVFSFAAARQQGTNPGEKIGRDLEQFFEAALDELHLAGMSVSIVKGDRVVWEDGFGLADIERNVPVDPGVLFHQGSVSKTVTAAALLRLREQARFTLTDDINRYLPFTVHNPRHPDVPITLRMLLTHTSSISDVSVGPDRLSGLTEGRDSVTPVEEVLKGYLTPDGKYYTEENFSVYA